MATPYSPLASFENAEGTLSMTDKPLSTSCVEDSKVKLFLISAKKSTINGAYSRPNLSLNHQFSDANLKVNILCDPFQIRRLKSSQ